MILFRGEDNIILMIVHESNDMDRVNIIVPLFLIANHLRTPKFAMGMNIMPLYRIRTYHDLPCKTIFVV